MNTPDKRVEEIAKQWGDYLGKKLSIRTNKKDCIERAEEVIKTAITQHHQDLISEVVEILDRHCEWKPTEGFGSEEEKGFQKGLQAEAKLIRSDIIKNLTRE